VVDLNPHVLLFTTSLKRGLNVALIDHSAICQQPIYSNIFGRYKFLNYLGYLFNPYVCTSISTAAVRMYVPSATLRLPVVAGPDHLLQSETDLPSCKTQPL
jgi:hypothetical protein